MHRIRVILAQMPPMLRDILKGVLVDQADILLLADARSSDEVGGAIEHWRPDVIVTGLDLEESRSCWDSLLRQYPRLAVFSIPEGGGGAYAWTLRLHREPLGDVSPNGLIEAIRRTVQQRAEEM